MILNELFEDPSNVNVDEVVQEITHNCRFFFDQAGGYVMLRGVRMFNLPYGLFPFRPRRGPSDSPMALHNTVNAYCQKFGHPFRDGLFCTGSPTQASGYGKAYACIPVGKFDWLSFSGIYDMYHRYLDFVEAAGDRYGDSNDFATYFVNEVISTQTAFNNRDLDKCLKMKTEIMVWCKKYYLVDIKSEIAAKLFEDQEE